MQRQVVLTEEEYNEIKMKLNEYERLKDIAEETEAMSKHYQSLESVVMSIFKQPGEEIIYYETSKNYSNKLIVDGRPLSILFNHYFGVEFFEKTGFTVDECWHFK